MQTLWKEVLSLRILLLPHDFQEVHPHKGQDRHAKGALGNGRDVAVVLFGKLLGSLELFVGLFDSAAKCGDVVAAPWEFVA